MKNLIVGVILGWTAMYPMQAQTPEKEREVKQSEIMFEKETHDFGSIPQGVPATYTFVVKNTGKAPLILTNAAASCGCTKPEYTAEPIPPGKKGFIKVTYNAASTGEFSKTVTVTSNAVRSTVVLYIRGSVNAAGTAGTE